MSAGDGKTGRWSVDRTEVVVLLVVALVRVVHLAGMLQDPLAGLPTMDPQYHDVWAQKIAHGQLTFGEPFFRAPLYPYFLGLLYAISGSSIPFARGAQLALGLLSVFFLIRIGTRVFGRRVGLVAGAAWGIYPITMRTEGDLLVEGLFILFALAALLAWLRALERPTRFRWFGTGVLFGLAAITRVNILLPALAVPAVTALQRRGQRPRLPLRRVAAEAAWLGFGLLLPILPVTLHNAIVGHDFVPIASQGGVNFYIGNNPRADGFTAFVPGGGLSWDQNARALAEKSLGRPLRGSEVSDYYTRQGLHYWVSEPAGAVRLLVRKLYLFWWGAEISNNQHEYFLRRYSWPLRLTLWHAGVYFPFGLVAALALLGLGLAWGRTRARALPLVAFAILYMVSVVAFFVCARFRLPAVPVLLLFAVYAAGALPGLWRGGARGKGLVAGLAALTLFLNADPYRLQPAVFGSQALSYIDLGLWNAGQGRMTEAEQMLRQAVRLDPRNPIPHAWLGRFALRRGDFKAAEAELQQAIATDREMFRGTIIQARCDLGRVNLQRGRYPEAREQFRQALALDEKSADAIAGVGFASLALGDTATARSNLERAAALAPQDTFVRDALARLKRGPMSIRAGQADPPGRVVQSPSDSH